MKQILLVIVVFISTLVSAQSPIERSIGEFSELKVYDLIEVELIKSQENKVVITGENRNDVVFNNKNGKLKIKMKLEKIFNGSDTKVKLYYTTVDVLDGNEGAIIYSENEIKQYEIDLKTQEGAKINVKLNTSYTNVKSVTGGEITAEGSSKNQKIVLLTGGVYNGESLKTEYSKVTIKAAGEAYINASKKADIKIRAGGDVYIYGNPEIINESKVFGGRIKHMD